MRLIFLCYVLLYALGGQSRYLCRPQSALFLMIAFSTFRLFVFGEWGESEYAGVILVAIARHRASSLILLSMRIVYLSVAGKKTYLFSPCYFHSPP